VPTIILSITWQPNAKPSNRLVSSPKIWSRSRGDAGNLARPGQIGGLDDVLEYPLSNILARDDVADGLALQLAGDGILHAGAQGLLGLGAVRVQAAADDGEILAGPDQVVLHGALVLVRLLQHHVVQRHHGEGDVALQGAQPRAAEGDDARLALGDAPAPHVGEHVHEHLHGVAAQVRVVVAKLLEGEGGAERRAHDVDEGPRARRVDEAARERVGVQRVALLEPEVGRARAQLLGELGRRPAECDARVPGSEASAEGRETAAAGRAQEEDRLLAHFVCLCGWVWVMFVRNRGYRRSVQREEDSYRKEV